MSAVPVLVLNFNGWDDTLAGLAEMSSYLSNIWVIDNGSDLDRTADIQLGMGRRL
jgi:hypothetical protein